MSERSSSTSTYLLVPILLIALLLGAAAIRNPALVSLSGFGSAIIVAAPLILATYSLMALAVAGRGTVDLAVGPLLAFINVSIVKLNMLGIISVITQPHFDCSGFRRWARGRALAQAMVARMRAMPDFG
jgi:ribose transport system permease protein